MPKCEATKGKSNFSLRCKYVEFGENLAVKIAGKLDSGVADFWNAIDDTLAMKKQTQQLSVHASP